MNNLMNVETITSLKLLEEINLFRNQEGGRSSLAHNDLLKVIRDEFEEEIGEGKFSLTSTYKDSQGKERPMFILTIPQGKQVLVRESKFVRKAVIKKLDEQINKLKHNEKEYLRLIKPLENIELDMNIDDLVYSKNGKPITTSRIIASKFNKEHREILRAIDNKISSNDKSIVQFCTMNISQIEYMAENGQIYREYELTEQGFSFIALSLTGENADIFKIEFINSFFKMRQSLISMFKVKILEEVLPQDNRSRQYVYIIKNNDTNRLKVGVAQNVEKRLKQLQTGSDSELILVYKSNLCSNAFSIENFMHDKFSDYHFRGEWFHVNEGVVINELEKQKYVLKSELIKMLDLNVVECNVLY